MCVPYAVIEWEADDLHQELIRLSYLFFLQDGGEGLTEVLAETGEPLLPALSIGIPTTKLTTAESKAGVAELAAVRKQCKWNSLCIESNQHTESRYRRRTLACHGFTKLGRKSYGRYHSANL
jgi:hypothetical protein